MRALIAAAVVLALATSPSALGHEPSFVIQGDFRIGGYAVKRDGSLRGMIAAFDQPSTVRRGTRYREICYVAWRPIGLRVTFYNLGGGNPCAPELGRFSRATMTSKRWRTTLGLRVGDSVQRLRTLYPRARTQGASRWLVVRRSPFGEGGLYAGLAARMLRGRVRAFVVQYPAGGD